MSSSHDGAERPSYSSESRASSSKQSSDEFHFKRYGTRDRSSFGAGIPASSGGSRHASADLNVPDDLEEEALARKRHRSRHSAGFLLDSINPLRIVAEKARTAPSEKSTEDGHVETRVKKPGQGSRNHGKQKARTSIGRSPLGIEVMGTGDATNNQPDAQNDTQPDRRSQVQNDSSVFGADQLQIVNLALSLSENRRRHFSASRITPSDPTSSRRIISSSAIPSSVLNTPAVDGTLLRPWKQEWNNGRASSGHYEKTDRTDNPRFSLRSQEESSSNNSTPNYPTSIPLDTVEPEHFYPSEATILRVEKAKTALELTYEYRRLLQYLPKLPAVSDSRPSTAKNASKRERTTELLGRQYNPLQYIRNRKIRARERKPLDAEADGWRNVDVVRSWVDNVADERDLNISSSNNRFPLPPFPPDSVPVSLRSPGLGLGNTPASKTKESRSRSDWITNSWDMLADTYWLEQDTNMTLIEDHEKRKLYPTLNLPPQSALEQPKFRRSASIPRSINLRNSVLISESAQKDPQNLGRGRQRHQRHHSFTSTRSYSTSRDRKMPWRRLIGPQSPSNTDDSGSDNPRKRSRRPPRMSSRDRQDSIILEKQVMDLMAKEGHKINWEKGTGVLGEERPQEPKHRLSRLSMSDERSESGNEPLTAGEQSRIPGSSSQLSSPDHKSQAQTQRFSGIHSNSNDNPPYPKIAINISPPRSRSRTAKPPENAASQEASTQLTETTMEENEPSNKLVTRSIDETSIQSPATDSPSIAHLSPKSAASANRLRRSSSGGEVTKNKSPKDFESRLRGLLKGTKISNIVGVPVARVGDLIWKRDLGEADVFTSPATYTPEGSDTEETTSQGPDSRDSTLTRDSRYRPTELPVFRSPFRGRDRKPATPGSSLRPSPEINDNRKPERCIQNAPPPLDMRSVSPSPAPSRVQSPDSARGPGQLGAQKPNPEPERTTTQRRPAIANSLSEGNSLQQPLGSSAPKQSLWPSQDGLQYINITKRLLSPLDRPVRSSDISLLRAMLQCALVTSSGINRQYKSPLSPTSRTLHVVVHRKLDAAHGLTSQIQSQSATINTSLETLSQITMTTITARLKAMDVHITSRLTPVVRSSGADADELSAELATTRTLEVKKLNDAFDAFVRRKRRRLRWLRRGGSWAIEWTLIGFMWFAWLVVTCVKIVRAVCSGVYGTVKWLLWL